MSNSQSSQILDEMVEVSAHSIKVIENISIPYTVKDQLTKSLTSIGANYAEAQDASSRKDFLNKIYIAKKEANETLYWIKLVKSLANQSDLLDSSSQKVQHYLMMFQKIINTTRSKPDQKLS